MPLVCCSPEPSDLTATPFSSHGTGTTTTNTTRVPILIPVVFIIPSTNLSPQTHNIPTHHKWPLQQTARVHQVRSPPCHNQTSRIERTRPCHRRRPCPMPKPNAAAALNAPAWPVANPVLPSWCRAITRRLKSRRRSSRLMMPGL